MKTILKPMKQTYDELRECRKRLNSRLQVLKKEFRKEFRDNIPDLKGENAELYFQQNYDLQIEEMALIRNAKNLKSLFKQMKENK